MFYFAGPKSYAYQTNDGKTTAKVKGFTLNGRAENIINFQSMLKMLDDKNVLSVTYPKSLKRVKNRFAIEQVTLSKRLSLTYDKRRIVDNEWNTLPYGYVSQ